MTAYRTVSVNASLTDSIISVTPSLSSATISENASIITTVSTTEAEDYTGATEVTPTTETQTLQTAGTVLRENITINPIPSNYGLITWTGSVLTVS